MYKKKTCGSNLARLLRLSVIENNLFYLTGSLDEVWSPARIMQEATETFRPNVDMQSGETWSATPRVALAVHLRLGF